MFRDRLRDGSDGPEMIVIPAGEFWMGSPESEAGRIDNERRHRVVIARPFAIGQYAVTFAEYDRFCTATGRGRPADQGLAQRLWELEQQAYVLAGETFNLGSPKQLQVILFERLGLPAGKKTATGQSSTAEDVLQELAEDYPLPRVILEHRALSKLKSTYSRDNRPVIEVDWYDALNYTEWLSEQTGRTYRLPTEAEWEYAGRAGTTTPFWWGESITSDQANYNGNYTYGLRGRPGVWRVQTVPVGQFQPNPWGLYQVHGNVWEWTGSVYDQDYGGAEQQCAGRAGDGARAFRGGSWNSKPAWVRSAGRAGLYPTYRSHNVGFRLARSL